MQIDQVEVCEPIKALVEYLTENGCETVEQKVSDYHFHEVYIKMQSDNLKQLDGTFIKNIEKVDNTSYSCSCHWSIVEIIGK